MSFACHSYDACRPFVTLEVRNLIDDVGILQCQRDSGGQEAAIGAAGTFRREEALDSICIFASPCEQRGLRYTTRAGWGGLRGGGKAIMSLSGRRTMWCQSSRIRKVSRALLRID